MPRQLVQIGQIDQQGRVFADADMGQMQQGGQGGQTIVMGGGGLDLSLRAAASGFQALTSLVRRANLKDLEDDEKAAREALRTQVSLGNQAAASAGTDPVKQQQAILAMASANMKVLSVLDANSALNKEQDRMATDSAISGTISALGEIFQPGGGSASGPVQMAMQGVPTGSQYYVPAPGGGFIGPFLAGAAGGAAATLLLDSRSTTTK
ncbi:MAG: hypothetical protein U1A78_26655 [Polyangia bacterium]